MTSCKSVSVCVNTDWMAWLRKLAALYAGITTATVTGSVSCPGHSGSPTRHLLDGLASAVHDGVVLLSRVLCRGDSTARIVVRPAGPSLMRRCRQLSLVPVLAVPRCTDCSG